MTAPKCCARCGIRLPAAKPRVHSRFTGSYYCIDVKACARRAKRLKHSTEAVPA